MTRNEALELIERIPYIRAIQAPSDKILEEHLEQAIAKQDCLEWIKIIKTLYIRGNDTSKRYKPLSANIAEIGLTAKKLLHTELASALDIAYAEVEDFISNHLAATI